MSMKIKVLLLSMFVCSYIFSQDSAIVKRGKPIDKVKIWKNGKSFDADDIDVVCAYEDYESSATLYYTLRDSTGSVIAHGNVIISGADYIDFKTKPNHADRAILYTMRYLNIQERARKVATQAAKASTTVSKN